MTKSRFTFLIIGFFAIASFVKSSAQNTTNAASTPNPVYVAESTLAYRVFPLFSRLLEDQKARNVVLSDPALVLLTKQRWANVSSVTLTCKGNALCQSQALRFTPVQIDEATLALRRLYRSSGTLRTFVAERLLPREMFTLDPAESDEKLFLDAWIQSAKGMNQILATYCDGIAPRYPRIDSMTYSKYSENFEAILAVILDELPLQDVPFQGTLAATTTAFFEPTLRFSMRLLEANMRDEAGRFWPLESGDNALAVQSRSGLDWKRYRYSIIVVPGEGPETPGVALSALGKERLRLAWIAWRDGGAPYILVSGGFVHPSQTPYCEAIEMKKYLIHVYGVPEAAILLDPYARHTTTNLRNAARDIYDYGLPDDRPMLLVSDLIQMGYIQSDVFKERTKAELGYLPVTLTKGLSATSTEAIPSRKARFVDPSDPLDP